METIDRIMSYWYTSCEYEYVFIKQERMYQMTDEKIGNKWIWTPEISWSNWLRSGYIRWGKWIALIAL